MKIAYIADHRGRGNDDESAIAHALAFLGHEVVPIQEQANYSWAEKCDFVLFHHHWHNLDALEAVSRPKVFWFFDLIYHPKMPRRNGGHFQRMARLSRLGFCTDGYGAERYGNVHHLMQGADARIIREYTWRKKRHAILFAGTARYSAGRVRQLRDLRQDYGSRLLCLLSRRTYRYRLALAETIARTKIVISLQCPSKDDYWSNRVYVVSGFGGFLIHPYCAQLAEHYAENEEIVFYRTPDELKEKIDHYLPLEEERARISGNALRRTLAEHTYTHRCKQMMEIVQEKLPDDKVAQKPD